jgi:hypothetical protein
VLVLFDIDGTLVHGLPEGHTRAMTDAMRAVWGVPVTPDDVWATHPAGRTDREIARLVLRGHGVADAHIDAGNAEWMDLACRMHAEVAHLHVEIAEGRLDTAHLHAQVADAGTRFFAAFQVEQKRIAVGLDAAQLVQVGVEAVGVAVLALAAAVHALMATADEAPVVDEEEALIGTGFVASADGGGAARDPLWAVDAKA